MASSFSSRKHLALRGYRAAEGMVLKPWATANPADS
jgi:hypothetical protein